MATLIVSYPLSQDSTFDRDYYIATHIPLVQNTWGNLGLQSAEILFPAAGPQPLAGLAILRFESQARLDAALSSPAAAKVIGDVGNFTNIVPLLFRADD